MTLGVERLEPRDVPSGWAGAFLQYAQATALALPQQAAAYAADPEVQSYGQDVGDSSVAGVLATQFASPAEALAGFSGLGLPDAGTELRLGAVGQWDFFAQAHAVNLVNAGVYLYQHGQLDAQDVNAFFVAYGQVQAVQQQADLTLLAFVMVDSVVNPPPPAF